MEIIHNLKEKNDEINDLDSNFQFNYYKINMSNIKFQNKLFINDYCTIDICINFDNISKKFLKTKENLVGNKYCLKDSLDFLKNYSNLIIPNTIVINLIQYEYK